MKRFTPQISLDAIDLKDSVAINWHGALLHAKETIK